MKWRVWIIRNLIDSHVEEKVEITLYALLGTPTPGTMRLKGRIKSGSLMILMGTGSTHTFINVALVSSLQLYLIVKG